MAMEGDLNDLTNQKIADTVTCAQLAERIRASNEAAGLQRCSCGLAEAIGQTARVVMP
jgi:hypothetical protein